MPGPLRRWHAGRERGWARSADARTTVNDALADAARRPVGHRRAPRRHPQLPGPPTARPRRSTTSHPDLIRAELGLAAEIRIVAFQGRLGPNLGLDEAAEAILLVPDAALVLIGFGRWSARSAARDRDPRFAGRHFTLPARHPDELPEWTASADASVVPLPPISFNQRHATPNKFWESVAVGTPVVVGPDLPVMDEIVVRDDVGTVADLPWAGRPGRGDPQRDRPSGRRPRALAGADPHHRPRALRLGGRGGDVHGPRAAPGRTGPMSAPSVVMFVLNSVENDSRVLREAASLRDAGWAVSIVGRLGADAPHLGPRETRDGVEIAPRPRPDGLARVVAPSHRAAARTVAGARRDRRRHAPGRERRRRRSGADRRPDGGAHRRPAMGRLSSGRPFRAGRPPAVAASRRRHRVAALVAARRRRLGRRRGRGRARRGRLPRPRPHRPRGGRPRRRRPRRQGRLRQPRPLPRVGPRREAAGLGEGDRGSPRAAAGRSAPMRS